MTPVRGQAGKVLAVIPARFASTRLSGKPLALIRGVPMVRRVYESAAATGLFDELIVATDDGRIRDCVEAAGGRARMTRAEHASGTDRVAEVAAASDADVVVNIQGDLPFFGRALVEPLLRALGADAAIAMATIAVPIGDRRTWQDPNVVKVVTDEQGFALYFSRAPIPARRDAAAGEPAFGLRHVGIYGYRREFLLRFTSWPPSRLEQTERLEQLRALERGVKIFVGRVSQAVVEVDTAEDLERANRMAEEAMAAASAGVEEP
ncbi:MAG: 3-deoxy-manno-octulosonate cytidylyltransferase [Deltaproteobacteria bacterium]|nr:3-deoxy-manno-octulosonate cytidylyltransferase [Deltaproteobacteria bacterium]